MAAIECGVKAITVKNLLSQRVTGRLRLLMMAEISRCLLHK